MLKPSRELVLLGVEVNEDLGVELVAADERMCKSSRELVLLGVEVTGEALGVEVVAADVNPDPSNVIAPSLMTPNKMGGARS